MFVTPKRYSKQSVIASCICLIILLSLFSVVPSASATPHAVGAWAGYGFDGIHDKAQQLDIPKISEVTAQIEIPCIPSTAPLGTFHTWIGIGGVRTNNVIKAGVSAGSYKDRNGVIQTQYLAWIAAPSQLQRLLFPSYLQFFTFSCPDTISIEVSANGHYLISSAKDPNNGSRRIDNPSLGAADVSTAEFVTEGSGQTLAASDRVTFWDCFIHGSNPITGSPDDRWGLNDLVHRRLNSMSGVTTSDPASGGTSFYVSGSPLNLAPPSSYRLP